MQPEAWVALAAILTPLVASAVSNVGLRRDVRGLRNELLAFCKTMKDEIDHVKVRVLALEIAVIKKPKRKAKKAKPRGKAQ